MTKPYYFAWALLLTLAAAFGACRGGGRSSSATPAPPVSTAAPGQTAPSGAGPTAAAPDGTPPAVVGPISLEEAFSAYPSGVRTYEIDLGTRRIYVYNPDPPAYAQIGRASCRERV